MAAYSKGKGLDYVMAVAMGVLLIVTAKIGYGSRNGPVKALKQTLG
jgi:hypothetical protein